MIQTNGEHACQLAQRNLSSRLTVLPWLMKRQRFRTILVLGQCAQLPLSASPKPGKHSNEKFTREPKCKRNPTNLIRHIPATKDSRPDIARIDAHACDHGDTVLGVYCVETLHDTICGLQCVPCSKRTSGVGPAGFRRTIIQRRTASQSRTPSLSTGQRSAPPSAAIRSGFAR